MLLYPAVDIKAGRVVRAPVMGDRGVSPIGVARALVAEGASWIHVVDMDRAFQTGRDNSELVSQVCRVEGASVQVGGNVSEPSWGRHLARSGARRIVFGTSVGIDESQLATMVEAILPAEAAVAVEVRGPDLFVRGGASNPPSPSELVEILRRRGIETVVHRDVERDGQLSGANISGAARLVQDGIQVIAAGGVASLDEIQSARDAGLRGLIIGRALHEGLFTFSEALACLA